MKILLQRVTVGDWTASVPELKATGRGRNAAEAVGRLVIDYKPGAGGNVASEVVARAAPDGYTFLLATAATHGVNAALYKRLPFDVETDFTPISTLNDVSNVLMINPNVMVVPNKSWLRSIKIPPTPTTMAMAR